jgi:Fe-S cluster biogenesis protein NfuA
MVIRSALKRGIKKVLGMEPAADAAPMPAPVWKVPSAAVAAPVEPVAVSTSTAVPEKSPEAAPEAPAEAAPQAAAVAAPAEAAVATPVLPTDDTAGLAFTFEAVQEIMDEMVRPALQGDGGDITLLRIENNDIYVKLVGSCSTCPSSILTMKMGVEALLKEEFPAMNSLIQVD